MVVSEVMLSSDGFCAEEWCQRARRAHAHPIAAFARCAKITILCRWREGCAQSVGLTGRAGSPVAATTACAGGRFLRFPRVHATEGRARGLQLERPQASRVHAATGRWARAAARAGGALLQEDVGSPPTGVRQCAPAQERVNVHRRKVEKIKQSHAGGDSACVGGGESGGLRSALYARMRERSRQRAAWRQHAAQLAKATQAARVSWRVRSPEVLCHVSNERLLLRPRHPQWRPSIHSSRIVCSDSPLRPPLAYLLSGTGGGPS